MNGILLVLGMLIGAVTATFVLALMNAGKPTEEQVARLQTTLKTWRDSSNHWEAEYTRMKDEANAATHMAQYWRGKCMEEWQARSSYPSVKIECKEDKEAV